MRVYNPIRFTRSEKKRLEKTILYDMFYFRSFFSVLFLSIEGWESK